MEAQNLKPSEYCKKYGLTLKQVAEFNKQSPQTLINWCKNKPELFKTIVHGTSKSYKRGASDFPQIRVHQYLKIVQWAKDRYRDNKGDLSLYNGFQDSKYTAIEKAAYKRYIIKG